MIPDRKPQTLPHRSYTSVSGRLRNTHNFKNPGLHGGWTEDEQNTVTRMVAAGATNGKITEAWPGRTVSAVEAFRNRNRILPENYQAAQPWTEDEKTLLTKMVADGAKLGAITKAMPGRTKSAVKNQRLNLGLKSGAGNHKKI